MKIDAVAVTSEDLKKSVAFYTLLEFKFGPFADDEQHIEPVGEAGSVRLMIDAKELIKNITGNEPVPATHSSFAMKCESPKKVNEIVKKISDAGFKIVKEPWDAFWGQRYATVADPDGYLIDLFAQL